MLTYWMIQLGIEERLKNLNHRDIL